MYGKFQDFLKAEIQSIKDAGLYKTERLIATPQDAEIKLTTGETVLNFCANNYLGLSSHPRVIEGPKILFYMLLVSMPTEVFSNLCSVRKTLSSPMS